MPVIPRRSRQVLVTAHHEYGSTYVRRSSTSASLCRHISQQEPVMQVPQKLVRHVGACVVISDIFDKG